MKNFFEHQDQARRTTAYLVFLFGCAIIGTILAIYFVCMMVAVNKGAARSLWHPGWLTATAIGVCLVIAFGSLRKMATLRGGGAVVAQSLGGELVSQDTSDLQARELLNVVEEMAIASGVAVPEVYLLPEASINAFAAGLTPNSAAIGVTKGCISALNREQLQGVIGHEFSHIVNGDMALNLKLMGLLHGLLLIHLLGRELLFGRTRRVSSSRDDSNGAVMIMAFAVMIIGGIGWLFGQLIKSAVSRQREFLADASAVQFTRNPDGITDALRCIAQQSCSAKMSSSEAESASHLFFNNISLSRSFAGAFATHPPLSERIRRLGRGSAKLQMPAAHAQPASAKNRSAQRSVGASPLGALGFAAQTAAFAGEGQPQSSMASGHVTPDGVVSRIGTVTPEHLTQAQSMLSHLPKGLLAAVRSQPGAVAVVYGLLLDSDEKVRSRQKKLIATSSQTVHDLLSDIEPLFAQVPTQLRLPLLELCIPTLKTIRPNVAAQFFTCVKDLVKADGKLSLSEYALQTVLQYRLAPHFRSEPAAPVKSTQLTDIWPDSLVLLSVLAKAGHAESSQADYAFRNGLSQLPGATNQPTPSALPLYSLYDVGRSLVRLRTTAPKLKQKVAEACAHTVLTDGHTTDKEAELLRAILISLGCPVPPFLNAACEESAIAA